VLGRCTAAPGSIPARYPFLGPAGRKLFAQMQESLTQLRRKEYPAGEHPEEDECMYRMQNDKWKAKGITRKWDSNGVVDHTEDRMCQLRSYVGTSTLHTKYTIPSSLRSETKRSESQVYFFAFFTFFRFFRFFPLFSLFFRLIFVSLRFFRLIFAYFTFVFASDFWCFASK
jgi:hypothetical protein